MNYNKFELMEFDLNKMVIDPSIVMIAKRGSGKSWIVRDVMYHYRHLPCGVVIAPTDRMNSFYKYFFPDLFIHYEITEAILKNILLRQQMIIDKQKQKKKQGLKIDPSGILIMDDCLSQKKNWSKIQEITEILMNGRHYRLTYILTMQTPLGLTPDLRLNFDYIFLLKDDTQVNKKKLYNNYAGMFPSQLAFEKVLAKCTESHKCMVIDNRKPADKIQDKVFWFKARDRKFSFGSREFKDMHKKYYNPEYGRDRYRKLMEGEDVLFGLKKNDTNLKVNLREIPTH
ncbi:VV A32 virion packaging ATPase [Acanthamoeba polyphaga mimivirus]|uniref:VV A32 virion packaging ATPase n=1 Tax=Acanthamoeba polyphaga mimivirus Kroon TaxID=3069720 RepID=A0A0G2Y327_9VIRU|nr:VV A32 virion packaging ATPase [Acanthamoeba polyphaga mimivirus]AKI80170.1 VV A32 virion packaging ATPase [Acanthamoeba polyphaga mimivirus Kroon]